MFTEQFLVEQFDFVRLMSTVRLACDVAIKSPRSFFVFVDRYAHWNGYAGSLIAALAGNIGLSQTLFVDRDEPDQMQAVRGLDVASAVFAATVDEHSDQGHRVPHKTLAQAMRKAAGDYAGLSLAERNELSNPPAWLRDLLGKTVTGYVGAPDDVKRLATALGFHVASEILADREYSMIDTVVRGELINEGFYQYLKERDYRVELRGARIHAYAWITLHGTHKGHGVEHEHFVDALRALDLAARYLPVERSRTEEWALSGFRTFVDLQQTFFTEVARECAAVNGNGRRELPAHVA